MSTYVADRGPASIRIYTAAAEPRLVAVIRAVDHGDVEQLLAAYGWKRIGAWTRSDDMPAGHQVVTVERVRGDDPAIEALDRDQEHGQQRRSSGLTDDREGQST